MWRGGGAHEGGVGQWAAEVGENEGLILKLFDARSQDIKLQLHSMQGSTPEQLHRFRTLVLARFTPPAISIFVFFSPPLF